MVSHLSICLYVTLVYNKHIFLNFLKIIIRKLTQSSLPRGKIATYLLQQDHLKIPGGIGDVEDNVASCCFPVTAWLS